MEAYFYLGTSCHGFGGELYIHLYIIYMYIGRAFVTQRLCEGGGGEFHVGTSCHAWFPACYASVCEREGEREYVTHACVCMYMFVHVYVCAHIPTCVCVYVCARVCLRVRTRVCAMKTVIVYVRAWVGGGGGGQGGGGGGGGVGGGGGWFGG